MNKQQWKIWYRNSRISNKEVWKEIIGYEGFYEVSSLGRIRNTRTGKYIKPCLHSTGYFVVTLSSGSIKTRKQYKVHRLVSLAHISNPFGLPYINHIDCIKTNNSIYNLEWCTAQQNTAHAWKEGRMVNNYLAQKLHPFRGKYGKDNPKAMRVGQYDKNGILIQIWGSLIDVERTIGISSANICSHLKGRLNSAGGYTFKKL